MPDRLARAADGHRDKAAGDRPVAGIIGRRVVVAAVVGLAVAVAEAAAAAEAAAGLVAAAAAVAAAGLVVVAAVVHLRVVDAATRASKSMHKHATPALATSPHSEPIADTPQDHVRIAAIARNDAIPRNARGPVLRQAI